jgi:hypothetical protein
MMESGRTTSSSPSAGMEQTSEIQGGKDKDGNVVESLKDLTYAYIQSAIVEDLVVHRIALYERLKKGG